MTTYKINCTMGNLTAKSVTKDANSISEQWDKDMTYSDEKGFNFPTTISVTFHSQEDSNKFASTYGAKYAL